MGTWRVWWPGAIVGGLVVCVFAASEFAARAKLEVAGTVLSSRVVQQEPHNVWRLSRVYVIRDRATGKVVKYEAAGNDESLSQSIPTGAEVVKKRGELWYTVDGRRRDDFPVYWYAGMILVGMGLVVAGVRGGHRWFARFRET